MLVFSLPLWAHILVFFLAAGAIGVAGTRLARAADRLADRSGWGEALVGILVLGFITALPGLVASVTAAVGDHASIAVSNAIGGVAIQTTALAVADIAYRRANLEHAAASLENVMQTALLVLLLTLVLLILTGPDVTLGYIHPGTLLLFAAAAGAFYLAGQTRKRPMWRPKKTEETVVDTPAKGDESRSIAGLLFGLAISAAIVLVSGALVANSAGETVEATGISGTLAGGLFTAIATSLPELVTTTAAVRRGALTLAVSNIVGGNFFDVLFVAFADLAYLDGSLYHAEAVTSRELFLTGMTILLNVILLIGLVSRQKVGPARIGFESVLMLVTYLAGILVVFLLL